MKANKIVLVMIMAIVVLMFLFVPTFTFHEEEGLRTEYHFISNIPADQQINAPLLLVEWLGVLLVAAIIWSLISARKNKLKKGQGGPQDVSTTEPASLEHTTEKPASKWPDTDSHRKQSRE